MKPKPILIVGMGPAGLSASIFLRQRGLAVVAIDRASQPQLKIGESLPPNAQSLLRQLGVWTTFQQDHHLKCYSNKSVWGNDQVQFHDFIQQAPGYGWHIDRLTFEQMLVEKAEQLGVQLYWSATLKHLQWHQDHWEVGLKQEEGVSSIHASFLIDASGRNSWLGRRLGYERLYEDRQLALVAFLQSKDQELGDSSSLIETHPDGWWYSAKIPNHQLATTFFCQPTPEQKANWTQAEGWWALAKTSPQFFRRLKEADFQLLTKPHFISADSGLLEKLCGPGWLALGDAAMTYDPIASHGLMMSMLSGRDAAAAIEDYLLGKATSLAIYQDRLLNAFQYYQRERQQFYDQELRFPTSTYWKARQRKR
ncbi:MAG: NAD(P)/FAD-dependent oxidoreductase [Bacteroidota bacterium]